MKGLTTITALLTALIVDPIPADAQDMQLRSGYVLCEAPGQLSFFMEPNVFDFMDREPPDSVRVYPDGHPDKKGKLMVDGRFQTVTKGRKALERGWCQTTDDVDVPITSAEPCGSMVPEIPNGGCRKIHIGGSTWHTFGDAIQASDTADRPTLTVVTPNDRARLCPRPNCGSDAHLARVPTGTTLSIRDSRVVKSRSQKRQWYRVQYDGKEGWLCEADVQQESPQGSTAKAENLGQAATACICGRFTGSIAHRPGSHTPGRSASFVR